MSEPAPDGAKAGPRALRRRLRSRALDLLYPPCCPCCSGRPGLPPTLLCTTCKEAARRIRPPICDRCGEQFPAGSSPNFECWNCRGVQHGFDFAVAAYEYSGTVRELVHRLKYQSAHQLRRPLATLAAEALADPRFEPADDWVVVPVPIHFTRRFVRHFNQAEEIGRCLCRDTGLPFAPVLRRVRRTGAQARLDRAHRLRNLAGAIRLSRWAARRHPVAGRRVLLVDDVLTTGATASTCATVLTRDGGAKMVAVLTVARG